MADRKALGIVGGTGMLGGAIARRLLSSGYVAPDSLVVSNRSGLPAGLETWPGVSAVASNQVLADSCDTILLAVPPAQAGSLEMNAADTLVISVMAGVSRAQLSDFTGSSRVVRAMSSPAAEHGLAYSPWIGSDAVTDADRATVGGLLSACGASDVVADEGQIECFTALTGPVPGFVALFADAMVSYAVRSGIEPDIALKAIRQLFLSGGTMLHDGGKTPGDHVQEMIDYAGTTAAGLVAMRDAGLVDLVHDGLDMAVRKTRSMA
jgi:pyrroline-5-carboxylate reductase